MSTTNDGGPAFPHQGCYDPTRERVVVASEFADVGGMSLRDWFAGQALAGLAAGYYERHKDDPDVQSGGGPKSLAHAAYVHADYMLAAREGAAK